MSVPCGSDQALSLVWGLEQIADFQHEDAVMSVSGVFGISPDRWEAAIADRSWFVGSSHWHTREVIESLWNERYSRATRGWLDENVWHAPLWQLWLNTPKMVFAANLAYLIKISGRGTVVRLATYTGRNRTTVSKWARWKEEGEAVRLPPLTLMPRILGYFDLKATCDLHTEPLFLGRSEIRDAALRIQGKHYLEFLSGEQLVQAVRYLENESARQATKKMREDL